MVDGFLREDFHFTPYSTISYLIPGHKADAGLAPSPLEVSKASCNKSPSADSSSLKNGKTSKPRPKKRPRTDTSSSSEEEEGKKAEQSLKKRVLVVLDSDSD
ncbi:UNVERIFIED_CONTAM: hypothetical protein GTU68_016555 [Idotea baltica]|nr:hypothetical protein [Idotea baltica]